MERVYSTEELLQILAAERRACISGERLNLAAQPSGMNHVIDRLIEPTGIQKFTAYENFRNTIHQYQQEHQVSGLVWQEIRLGDRPLRFPQIDEQLASLPQDLRVLGEAKPAVIDFWQQTTGAMALFLSLQRGIRFEPIEPELVERIVARSQWATVTHHGRGETLEIILQLGWGKPEAARYRRDFPNSGSEFIHAVYPGREPLG